MPLCGSPISREHSPRTSGSVKLYDGRSQPQVADLGKSATCLGKDMRELFARRSREAGDSVLVKTGRRRVRFGLSTLNAAFGS